MIKLSFIVPFYGVEEYIGQCLSSLYSQDIPESDYEIICINDCSPDNSEDIVQQFQKRHNNLRLLRHETNRKLGAARNTGLAAARGKYVWFVDSDDYIRENCLNEILKCCEENDLEMIHWSVQDNSGRMIRHVKDSDVTTGINDLLYGSRDMTFPWNRVYNREFLIKHNLWFNDLWGGDVIHTIQSLNVLKRMIGREECYYYYRTDNIHSDMHSPGTAHKVISFSFVLAKALEDVSFQLSDKLLPIMDECVVWRINTSFKSILKLSLNEKKKFYKRMRENKELRAFVMNKANWKVRMVLLCPCIVYLFHPLFIRLGGN